MRFDRLQDWLDWLERQHPIEIDLGLSRVRQVARRCGLLQPAPWSVVVAGTNGKGSVVALLEALLRAAGYRTGAYTSPHIRHYNERVRINGRAVADQSLIDAFQRVQDARQGIRLTYFEFGTLAALDLIQRATVDVAILEVGLGGRLDAVNVVDGDCAVITSLGLDHQQWLGQDLASIALEKAGVFRPHKSAVCAEPEPPPTLMLAATERAADLLMVERDYQFRRSGERWSWRMGAVHFPDLPLPALPGSFQIGNAAAALAALVATPGLTIPGDAEVSKALNSVILPGRLEKLSEDPEVVVDVAHNPQACAALFDALAERPRKRTLAVLGVLSDKDLPGILKPALGNVDVWYLAGLPGPRGSTGSALSQCLNQLNPGAVSHTFNSVDEALRGALAAARGEDRIVVFGSFLTVQAGSDTMARHGAQRTTV